MKAIFGATLLAIPFLVVAGFSISRIGLAWTLFAFGLAGGAIAIILGGVVLISQ